MHLTWWVTRAKTTICCRLRHICCCCCCPGGRTSDAASCASVDAPVWLTAVHRQGFVDQRLTMRITKWRIVSCGLTSCTTFESSQTDSVCIRLDQGVRLTSLQLRLTVLEEPVQSVYGVCDHVQPCR